MKRLLLRFLVLGVIAQVAAADVWDDLATFESTDSSQSPPVAVNALIVATPAAEMGAIEDKLLGILASDTSTAAAKRFSCRMLQRVGTETCVSVLGDLLGDEILSHYARLTLERFTDSDAAGKALLKALGTAPDGLKVGILASLGIRGDEKAVKAIARYAASEDEALSKAAFDALGDLGTTKALAAIRKTTTPSQARWDAMLAAAQRTGDAKVLQEIYDTADGDAHKGAALRALVLVDESRAAPLVAGWLKEKSGYLRDVALTILARDGGEALTVAVVDILADVPPEGLSGILAVLAERGDPAALPAVGALVTSDDRAISDAALPAAAALGNAETVKLLLTRSAGAQRELTIQSLAGMTAPGVDAALTVALADASLQEAVCDVLARREVAAAIPALKALTGTDDLKVKRAAWNALATLAGMGDLDDLMKLIVATKDPRLAGMGKAALKSVSSRVPDKNRCVEIVGAYYDDADELTRMFILEMAAVAGSGKGLVYARQALDSGSPALYTQAVKSLAAWSRHQDVYDDLLAVARKAPDEKNRLLALRGYIAQAGKERNKQTCARLLTTANDLVTRPEEKRLIIATAQAVTDPAIVPFIFAYVKDADVASEARLSLLDQAKHFTERDQFMPEISETLALIIADPASDPARVKKAKEEQHRLAERKARAAAKAAKG